MCCIKYTRFIHIHNDVNSFSASECVYKTLKLIKRLAGMSNKEENIDLHKHDVVILRDNPQKRRKSTVQVLSQQEGLFSIEADAADPLDVDRFGTNVLMPALRDIRNNHKEFTLASSQH